MKERPTVTKDLRADLLAWIDARLEECERASKGPWVVGYNEGETLAIMSKPPWLGPLTVAFPVVSDLNPYHAALDARDANSKFISSSRTILPLVLRAVRAEVEMHQEVGGPDGYCDYCGEDGHGSPTDWPCPTVRRLHAALIGGEK